MKILIRLIRKHHHLPLLRIPPRRIRLRRAGKVVGGGGGEGSKIIFQIIVRDIVFSNIIYRSPAYPSCPAINRIIIYNFSYS